ncbi:MAG: hypothetical protein Q4A11_05135 [Brachymonas sp.]|nr:hypothetical protein [Brachymonas sp.]
MLRWTLALVVLANLLFFAWSQHWLAPLGLAPVSEGEPYRLQEQLHPEAIVLRPARPEAASRLMPAPSAPSTAAAAPAIEPASEAAEAAPAQ